VAARANESLNHLIDACDQQMITEDELLIERHHIKKAIPQKKNGRERRRSSSHPNDSPTGVETDIETYQRKRRPSLAVTGARIALGRW
jgi:hypothetical protein